MSIRKTVTTGAVQALVAALIASATFAQPSFYEVEPNDTPADASKVAGAVTLMGAFEGKDQDAFEWAVSDVDAQKRWTLELEGVPGTVTSAEVFRLQFADNGVDVIAKTKLLKVSSGGTKPGRIEDLLFEPGEYFLGVARAGSSAGGYRLHLRPGKKIHVDGRTPANRSQESAQKLRLRREYAAFFDAPESWFRFELDEQQVALRWQARAQVPVGDKVRLAVRDSNGKVLSQGGADKRGALLSRELELEPGAYFATLEGSETGAIRAIEVVSVGPRVADTAAPAAQETTKPGGRPRATTGSWALANRVDLGQPVSGRFGATKEQHYYAFTIGEAATAETLALRLEAGTDRKVVLCLLDRRGGTLQCRRAQSAVELPDLLLAAGDWGLMVEGQSGEPSDYTISLTSTGPIRPDSEAEPNDQVLQATGIKAGQQISGRFAGREQDFYRLLVTGEAQLWRFEVEGDGLGELRFHDGAGIQGQRARPGRGERTVSLSNVYLMPGKHHVSVKGDSGSYSLVAKPLGPPDPGSEHEPNDDASRAEVLISGERRFGLLENGDDKDHYRFSVANDEHLRLSIEPPAGGQLRVWLDYGAEQIASHRTTVGAAAVLQGMFSPGDYQVRLGTTKPSRERYQVTLERLPRFGCSVACDPVHTRKLDFADGQNPTSAPDELPISMALVPASERVTAYLRLGQRVPAELRLQNSGTLPLRLVLETATSDHRWAVAPATGTLELGSGESRVVELEIEVPEDAWADQPVVTSVRATDGTGAQVEAATEITVDGRADPVQPEVSWPVPDNMLGGLNVAWGALGGRLVGESSGGKPGTVPGVGRYLDQLIDGRVRPTAGPIIDPGKEVEVIPITVELTGSQPQEIVGILLNPVGREKSRHYLDEFELQLSLDGSSFDTVLRDRLKQLPFDQAFALERPTPARFARLVVLSAHNSNLRRGAGVGEWKVVARPGTEASKGRGWNLADPDLGGHVVWVRPEIAAGPWEAFLLTETQENPFFRLRAGQSQEWAVSFRHQRAARIARFEWVDSERAKPHERIDKVAISVALQSPVGPWSKIADWDRAESPDELVLEAPVWARYVRFTMVRPDKQSRLYAPDTLRIFEQPTDASYTSILGEWGESSRQAQYELDRGLSLADESHTVSGNNSRSRAANLALDQPVSGKVLLGEEEDWYQLTVPAGSNSLKIALSGLPTVRTVVGLLAGDGTEVPLHKAGSQPDALRFKAIVEPGKTYYFKVEEPPRAVVFAFDNSGSVQPFATAIYRAVNAYAGDLVPGRDVANILPFGGGLLMTDWMGEPYILRMVLNDYDRQDVSSEAEKSLDKATRALARRPGTKAVVLVTDAATPRFAKMWNSIDKVQPRVFTMRVGNADATGLYENLMQSWARVNDGHYDYLSTQGEMDRAFDRAATLLRQPAAYTLEVSATFEKAPGPGKLQVASGETGLGGAAVGLILDASGSMLKRLEGRRRIDIAKDLLSKAVGEQIPAGTPVALRVFGHREANSCRTDLVLPMQPLDAAAMQKTLAGISAMNLARTPIADSLAKVESDLARAKGIRIVLLVTDGEETCDGDPEAVLQKLSEQGIDLRLEIVGFAIADDDLKQQFESWAEQGGGRYFDAGDTASLERSLADALRIPFTVFDRNGSVVARGAVDGEPLELEQGIYRVVVESSPPEAFDKVEVLGEQTIVLEAGGP